MSGHHPDSNAMFGSYIRVATALFVLTVLTWVAALDWVPKSWGEAKHSSHSYRFIDSRCESFHGVLYFHALEV